MTRKQKEFKMIIVIKEMEKVLRFLDQEIEKLALKLL